LFRPETEKTQDEIESTENKLFVFYSLEFHKQTFNFYTLSQTKKPRHRLINLGLLLIEKYKLFMKLVVVSVATRVVVVEAFHDLWSDKVKVLLETELRI
jgi:hypothetical protein